MFTLTTTKRISSFVPPNRHSNSVQLYPLKTALIQHILAGLKYSPSLKLSTTANNNNQKKNKRKATQLEPEQSQAVAKANKMCSYDEDDWWNFVPEITHGESVVDRKSVFQGHCCAIYVPEHKNIVLDKLKENKKIENAFHNMWAYRIDKSDPKARHGGKSASIVQDCDDDGEQAAGGRMLTLLEILNVVNVMVVVTRWYGGIQLGPARFKHINNASRDALVKAGFVRDGPGDDDGGPATSSKGGGKSKKSGKRK